MPGSSRRRPTNVIDFASAVKRREASQHVVMEREEPVSFLPFSFLEPAVIRSGLVEVVIDRHEGVGLSMTRDDAEAFARDLLRAVRSGKKA